MQIVIDIPEDIYNHIIIDSEYFTPSLVNAFKNGTVLPKHGRLIDADALVKKYGDSVAFINGRVNGEYINVQTILEPYKEGDI